MTNKNERPPRASQKSAATSLAAIMDITPATRGLMPGLAAFCEQALLTNWRR